MVKHALRHRPDHIVIGEIRGDEAQDVLQALNTGHGGSLTTIHANTARDALTRVACCAKQAADDYPWDIICQLVAMAFNLVVHQRRLPGGTRGVSELIEVKGYDRNKAEFVTETLWERPAADVPAEVSARLRLSSRRRTRLRRPPRSCRFQLRPPVPISRHRPRRLRLTVSMARPRPLPPALSLLSSTERLQPLPTRVSRPPRSLPPRLLHPRSRRRRRVRASSRSRSSMRSR